MLPRHLPPKLSWNYPNLHINQALCWFLGWFVSSWTSDFYGDFGWISGFLGFWAEREGQQTDLTAFLKEIEDQLCEREGCFFCFIEYCIAGGLKGGRSLGGGICEEPPSYFHVCLEHVWLGFSTFLASSNLPLARMIGTQIAVEFRCTSCNP